MSEENPACRIIRSGKNIEIECLNIKDTLEVLEKSDLNIPFNKAMKSYLEDLWERKNEIYKVLLSVMPDDDYITTRAVIKTTGIRSTNNARKILHDMEEFEMVESKKEFLNNNKYQLTWRKRNVD